MIDKSSNAGNRSNAINPFYSANADDIELMLRSLCSEGMSPSEISELNDQIEALVCAAVDLRDKGFINLDALTLSKMAELDGFCSLANDERLSPINRARCSAIRDRMIAVGVKSVLVRLQS